MDSPLLQLLLNNESYLFERHLRRSIHQLVDPATRDFNFDRISARNTNIHKLIDILQTLPMMSDTRLVVLDDLEAYLSTPGNDTKNQNTETLLQYLKDPCPQTNLIMIVNKLDKRTTFYKGLSKMVKVIEFNPLYPNQLPQFILGEAKVLQLTLEPGAADLLVETVGTNMQLLVSELEKLGLYIKPETHILRKHVVELVSAGLLENVFGITKCIGQRDYPEVCKLYEKMKVQGESVIKIIALIINHFRKLLQTKSLMERQCLKNPPELASQLGIHPYFVKDYVSQSKGFHHQALTSLYKKLMGLSLGVRSNGPSPEVLFETFLQEVCVKEVA